jgi:arginine repressor
MSRPKKQIPLKDVKIKGLKTLIKEGKTQEQIAEYYRKKHDINVDQATISRRIAEIKKVTDDDKTDKEKSKKTSF